jgi:hypothetical protein
MENVRNVSRVIKLNDTMYLVKIELFDNWTETWETLYYSVVFGDKAPVNKFLETNIKSGIYDSITVNVAEPPENPEWIYNPDTNTYDPPPGWVFDEDTNTWLPPPL